MKNPILLIAGLALAVVALSALYTIDETEQAIIVQFGRPVGGVVREPGLHLKVPFVQVVHRFDKRWLEFDGAQNEIPTRDKKYIWVDTYARWRIQDPLRFFQAVRDERGGRTRLGDIVDGETRNAVASYDLIEIVRTSNRDFDIAEELEDVMTAEAQAEIRTGRQKIAEQVLEKSAVITPQFGIELVDVRFKRISYTESVQATVFQRMISERKRIAERSRSEGQGRAAEIRGQMERDVRTASSLGYRDAQTLMGVADAKAAAIYSNAYGKDATFYQFTRAMETLERSLGSGTTFIMATDSDLMKFLKSDTGR